MHEAVLSIQSIALGQRLRSVSLQVWPGELLALLGPNGAGKSSLMRVITGWEPPDTGSIVLNGSRIEMHTPEGRARIGLGTCPEKRRVFGSMTVRDNLLVASQGDTASRTSDLDGVLEIFPALKPHLSRNAWQLSGGQQQMLAIGRALMGRPRVLLLDEPSLGLAPALVESLFLRLRAITDSGIAIVLAEQNVTAALGIAHRAVVLKEGKIVLQGDAETIADHTALMSDLS